MADQVSYYDQFAKLNWDSIIKCPEPHLWTTDYHERGRVYQEMKSRVEQQEQLIEQYFNRSLPVLDLGCGFGRQAYWLAKNGYMVTGVDSSSLFILLAKELFRKHNLNGNFINRSIIGDIDYDLVVATPYRQVILFDVLEHIPPKLRKTFFANLCHTCSSGHPSTVIISLPHVKKRLSSQLNNRFRRAITQHLAFFQKREEHPYPIPGEKEIKKLAQECFNVDLHHTPATDYYILHRI
jgi:2-polyprenyl-3-methyl-5-hydroxy-6-metoxy-1,4-benzoquinol methylase